MPIYTCTIAESTLSADTKHALAGEIARIHSSINHVPSTHVNVAVHELAADGLCTDGKPASPVLVSGWVREDNSRRPRRGCSLRGLCPIAFRRDTGPTDTSRRPGADQGRVGRNRPPAVAPRLV